MERFVVMFGDRANGDAAMEEISRRFPGDEVEFRVHEFGEETGNRGTIDTVVGMPVPVTGGVVPMGVRGWADMDLDDEQRGFLQERATTDSTVIEIKARKEDLPVLMEIADQYNGQYFKRES